MDSTTLITIGSIGFAVLIFNGVLLGIVIYTRRKAAQASNWPTTTGTVKVSTIETRSDSEGGTTEYPVVIYNYNVIGREYESRRVYPGPQWGGTGARKVVARYPAGSQVQVFYNDQNPSEAMLENKAPGWLVWMWVLAGGIDLILCIVGVVVVLSQQSGN